jgi:hypothetical protein
MPWGRPGNSPSEVVLEHDPSKAHSGYKEWSCKQSLQYASAADPHVSKVFLWWNRKSFAGLEPLECA